MKNDEKKFRTGCLIIITLVLVCIIIYVKIRKDKNKDLNENGRYTIAVTYEKEISSKGNDYIKYYFYFKNNKYIGKGDLQLGVKVPNGRYFVMFSTVNPNNNFIYFDKPIPDSIIVAPMDGWSKLNLQDE